MLKPKAIEEIPGETKRIAKAAFPKGNIIMRLRDEYEGLCQDEDFATLFPNDGQPAYAPWRLAFGFGHLDAVYRKPDRSASSPCGSCSGGLEVVFESGA